MRRGALRRPHRARARAGFTLIELMISLLVSSLLVGMILSIFTRMSTAYRTQQHVAELQQVLIAAQEMIQRDLRQAGFAMTDGFKRANRPAAGLGLDWYEPPVQIIDNADGFGPDELRIFYGDPSAQARVVTFPTSSQLTVDAVDRFEPGNLVVISNHEMMTRPAVYDVGEVDPALPTDPQFMVAHHRACVARIASIGGTTFNFDTGGDWGEGLNSQCDFVRDRHAALQNTMIYRLAARGYRIDPDRRSMAVLQLSRSGGLVANDWEDLGAGFTDLQVASRWYENEDGSSPRRTTDTADLDTSAYRDWYSGADQTGYTAAHQRSATNVPTATSLLTELRVTLVVRTTRRIDTIGSARTPELVDPARPDNNDVGNRAAIQLDGVADASRPEELRGDHIYRYATVGSDLRNLAVSR